MNSNSFILDDNLMYLNAWMKQNTALSNLQVIDKDLIWKHDNGEDKINIDQFYLPSLLYNPNFQLDVQDANKMNAEDLFHIIKVHVLSQNYLNQQNTPQEVFITDFKTVYDIDGGLLVLFQDSLGHQYKVRTYASESIMAYQKLSMGQQAVKFSDFKKELERVRNER